MILNIMNKDQENICSGSSDGLGSKISSTQKEQGHMWLNAIQQATLTKHEARAAYKTMWFLSLSYGLGTTNLSYEELNNIQRPVINHLLPLLGYNRHLLHAVVLGSSKYGRLNLKHLYIDQGIKHVT